MAGESTPINDDLSGILDRITTSAGRIRDLKGQLAAELEIRNGLIVRGYDHAGIKQASLARAAGVTVPSITRVLSGSSED